MTNSKIVYTFFLDTGTEAWAYMKSADDESMYLGEVVGEYREWRGQHAISIEFAQEAASWLLEFERSELYNHENAAKFNWEDFHRRGFSLAKRFKLEVGNLAKVIYVKPSEDPLYNRVEGFEITNDGAMVPIRRLWWSPIV